MCNTLILYYRQVSMLNRKQRENSNPVSINDLIEFYIVPLEDIVKHFETLFLATEKNDTLTSLANLTPDQKEEAKHHLLVAIHPHIDSFFKLAQEFIQLPTSITTIKDTHLPQSDHLAQLQSALLTHTHALKSVAKIDERMIQLTADWESALIHNVFDSLILGLKDHFNQFILSLHQQANDTSSEFDTDRMAGFIQDTQTWLLDHFINTCLFPLKQYLDTTLPLTLSRIQFGIKNIWQKISDRFEVIHI